MKLHDLQPAEGSHKPRTRVGRGIAAGKGKTAGRGTKGQKARAGGSIPPWFEGGQTPLHMRIPKLRGFKNRFKIEYEVVNVGAIGALAERGAFEFEAPGKASKAQGRRQITVNQDILRAVGLVRTLNKPLKILGAGELTVAALRGRRRVHRVRPREDRGGRRQRQRPRGPGHAARGARRRRRDRGEAVRAPDDPQGRGRGRDRRRRSPAEAERPRPTPAEAPSKRRPRQAAPRPPSSATAEADAEGLDREARCEASRGRQGRRDRRARRRPAEAGPTEDRRGRAADPPPQPTRPRRPSGDDA